MAFLSCRTVESGPCIHSQALLPLPPPRGWLAVLVASPDTVQPSKLGSVSWAKKCAREPRAAPSGPPPALLMHLSCSCCPHSWPELRLRYACAWPSFDLMTWPQTLPGLCATLVTLTRPALLSLLRRSGMSLCW